jgi:hypothetical protein
MCMYIYIHMFDVGVEKGSEGWNLIGYIYVNVHVYVYIYIYV